ncbi:hypothetical protein MJ588_06665 [Klebsiella pneumoniae]|nr:hypothetical protein MJ588_06665 [Klebsiella pneumoniae]
MSYPSASPAATGVHDLSDDNFYDQNGKRARTSNSIASSHILALNYAHWHTYSIVARCFHNGGQSG